MRNLNATATEMMHRLNKENLWVINKPATQLKEEAMVQMMEDEGEGKETQKYFWQL